MAPTHNSAFFMSAQGFFENFLNLQPVDRSGNCLTMPDLDNLSGKDQLIS
jgi:hypothetical protein